MIGAINLALGLVYHVGFLMWQQATPASSMLGYGSGCASARPDAARRPCWRAGSRSSASGILGVIPFAGSLAGIYVALD